MAHSIRALRALLASALTVSFACAGSAETAATDVDPTLLAHEQPTSAQPAPLAASTGPVTYYQNVKPIVDAKCVRCHAEGSGAPFALTSYALTSKYAQAAGEAVAAGHMPPWKPAAGCNEYRGDFSLTDDEKNTLLAWVDQGAPEGDASHPGTPIAVDATHMSRVDLTLTLPEAYTPKQRPDEYRCFPIAWPKTQTAYMTGFHPVPGIPEQVHHIEVYHVPAAQAARVRAMDDRDPGPGYTCFSGPGAGTGTIGGWAMGAPGYDYPDGIGLKIEPGAILVVQVHYNTSATSPKPDRSKVELKVDDKATAGGYSFWTNSLWEVGRMPIPAGDTDVRFTYAADPTSTLNNRRPMTIYSVGLHMHNLGRKGYMKLKRKDGTEQCLLRIDDWDFHWQGGVALKNPVKVQPGDRLEMQCQFDNGPNASPHAPPRTGPPKDVNWGEGTADEMCLGNVLFGPG